MPRIYTSANDPLDFCKEHFPSETAADQQYGSVGEGPDGRGNCFAWDADHPNYDGEEYRCAKCGALLGEADNYID